MKIEIQSLHFTPNEALDNFTREKADKLSQFNPRIISADVCLKLDRSDETKNKVCEIRLSVPGNDLFSESRHESFEAAIAETVKELESQLKKQKTKRIRRRHAKVKVTAT